MKEGEKIKSNEKNKTKQNDNSWMNVGRKIICRGKIRNIGLENKKEEKLYWMKINQVLKKFV